ncbi:hypothetical protein D9M70_397010 [compost metagenome]
MGLQPFHAVRHPVGRGAGHDGIGLRHRCGELGADGDGAAQGAEQGVGRGGGQNRPAGVHADAGLQAVQRGAHHRGALGAHVDRLVAAALGVGEAQQLGRAHGQQSVVPGLVGDRALQRGALLAVGAIQELLLLTQPLQLLSLAVPRLGQFLLRHRRTVDCADLVQQGVGVFLVGRGQHFQFDDGLGFLPCHLLLRASLLHRDLVAGLDGGSNTLFGNQHSSSRRRQLLLESDSSALLLNLFTSSGDLLLQADYRFLLSAVQAGQGAKQLFLLDLGAGALGDLPLPGADQDTQLRCLLTHSTV